MAPRARRWGACLLAFALVATACTSNTTDTTDSPGTSQGTTLPIPPPPAPIAPILRGPGLEGTVFVGSSAFIGGMVVAENPIARLELWDGEVMVESSDLEVPVSEHSTGWDWVPETEGVHVLVLRAYDVNGGAATSFPVWVRVLPVPAAADGFGAPRPRAIPVSMTARVTVDATTCIGQVDFPAAASASGIAVYAASMTSIGFIPLELLPPGGGTASVPLSFSPLILYSESFDSTQANPQPPLVITPPPECAERGWTGDLQFEEGVLENVWGATKVYAYVSHDDMASWDRVPHADQTFIPTTRNGDFDFGRVLARARPGTTIHLDVWGWIDGVLHPLGVGRWDAPGGKRPPPGWPSPIGDLAPVGPTDGPMIIPSSLDWVQTWKGNVGEKTHPLYARTATICSFTPAAPTSTTSPGISVSVTGDTSAPTTSDPQGFINTYPSYCSNHLPGQPISTTFHWRPLGKPTQGLLQVSYLPPPDGPTLSFPGLLLSKKIDVGGQEVVEFEFDANNLPPLLLGGLWQGTSFSELFDGDGYFTGSGPVAPTFSSFGASTNRRHYIRIIPMAGENLLAGESNSVIFEYQDEALPVYQPEPSPPAIAVSMRLTPPRAPNTELKGCVRVVSNPFGSKNGLFPEYWHEYFEKEAYIYLLGVKTHLGMVPGSTVCGFIPKPPEKGWLDSLADAVKFITYVWDTYTWIWEKLKEGAALVLAYATGCVELAKAAGKNAADAEALCSGVALTAITAVMVAYGVPPTIPKFKDLYEMGKGEIKDVLITYAKDLGLDCGPIQSECDELMEDLLDQILNQIEKQASDATKQGIASSGYFLQIHPDIIVVPEPASTLSPATFEITIERLNNISTPPTSCTYAGLVEGHKTHYEWWDYEKKKQQAGPVSALLVQPGKTAIDLTGMAIGEKRTGILILDQHLEYYLPGQHPALPQVPWDVPDSKWIFYHDTPSFPGQTTITMSISGCGSVSQSFTMTNAPATPKDIPYP